MRFRLQIAFLIVAAPAAAGEAIQFNRDIRPILSDKCFACHGPDAHERKADLRLDVESIAKESAIVPGDPGKSELVFRLTDDEDRMPPEKSGKRLTPAEIELLTRWVGQGAPYEAFWAYEPPKNHPTPDGDAKIWIDRFVVARLEAEGLKPSPEADRVTLVRRLFFDLTGLPPTAEQVDAFEAKSTNQWSTSCSNPNGLASAWRFTGWIWFVMPARSVITAIRITLRLRTGTG